MPEEDLSRLPKWAQRKISGLQDQIGVLTRNLADAHQNLTAGPADSDTFADPYSEVARPLGKRITVRFGGAGFNGTFDVNFADGVLQIHGQGGSAIDAMAVVPKGSNAVHLRWIDRSPG